MNARLAQLGFSLALTAVTVAALAAVA